MVILSNTIEDAQDWDNHLLFIYLDIDVVSKLPPCA
jgi:hypothetical protein